MTWNEHNQFWDNYIYMNVNLTEKNRFQIKSFKDIHDYGVYAYVYSTNTA